MPELVNGSGAAADAGVSTAPRADEADLEAEYQAEVASAEKAVEKAKAHLKGAEQGLAQLKKERK